MDSFLQALTSANNRFDLVVCSAVLVSGNFPTIAQAADKDLDPTFGEGGKVTTDFSNSIDTGNAIALQSDGRAVVAGSTIASFSNAHDFALARYKVDGSLDGSFGAGGRTQTDFFGSDDEAFAVTVQRDGRIIAAGISGNGASEVESGDFALARYNLDGTLDPTFEDSLSLMHLNRRDTSSFKL